MLGKDNIKILEQIKNMSYQKEYESLIIKNIKELDIDLKYLNKNNKERIIRAILNKKISNNQTDIMNYINNL